MTDKEIYDRIILELSYFKLNRNSMAYEYLIDAIYLVIKERKYIKNFNQKVYPKIAKVYGTNPKNVLWCITKLLDLMYINTDSKVIEKYFNLYYDEKPSAKAFIMYVSRKISNDIMTNNKYKVKL